MEIKLKPLNEQVVCVVGASSGMGRDAAAKFAAQGARVVVAARGEEGLQSLVEEIRSAGGTAEYRVADVSDFEQVQAVVDLAVDRFGGVDTWVNTAGIWITAKFEETKPEEFRRILDVNIMGQAHGIWAVLPQLKNNHQRGEPAGSIIVFSSVLGQLALPLTSAYCSSKHGLNGLIDSLRIELIQQNLPINITNIMPFGTNTPIYNTGLSRIGEMPRPAPPIIQPEVVADSVIHAAAHPSRQIYGSGRAKAIALMNQIAPHFVANILAFAASEENQKSGIPIREDQPNSLFEAVPDWRIHGEFDSESLDRSPYVLMQSGEQPDDGMSEVDDMLDMIFSSPGADRLGISKAELLRKLIELQAVNW